MIHPFASANRIATDFVVTDIENRGNGEVLAIDTFDGTLHYENRDWGTWLDFIARESKKRKEFRTIYAHNGGGWDWLSLIEYIARFTNQPFYTVQNGGTVIAVKIPIDNGVMITLVDSYRLLDCSLDKAAKTYLGRGKVHLDHLPEWYWENDRELFKKYHKEDTEVLYHTLISFSNLIFTKLAAISRLGITLPSTSMRIFRTGYLVRPISVPLDDKVKSLLRFAYAGGRVEVFKPGYYKRVNVYDFNSLYPSVMHNTPVPMSGNVQWTNKLRLDTCGVYRVRFNQIDRSKPPVLMVNGNGSYEGEGVYFTNELRRLFERASGRISVIEGFLFTEQSTLFSDFVERLYNLRMTDKDGPIGDVCKKAMNSLYGKWAQKPERSKTMRLDYGEMVAYRDSGCGVDLLSEEYGIYRITEKATVPYEHVGIAGTITSEARARLWESLGDNPIYCDTDSIHTESTFETDALGLGKLKLEFSGEGVYCGKKLYALRDGKKEKVRAKGIRIAKETDLDKEMGCKLDFSTLQTLLSGDIVECRFKGATTSNQVFRGGKSCIMSPRKRRIRMTVKNGKPD